MSEIEERVATPNSPVRNPITIRFRLKIVKSPDPMNIRLCLRLNWLRRGNHPRSAKVNQAFKLRSKAAVKILKQPASSLCMSCTEIFRHKRGMFCKYADARSIANSVKRIFGSSLRQELEANALRYGKAIGWEVAADKYGDIFRSAISTHRTIARMATVSETSIASPTNRNAIFQ